jgi:hypothetical protein
MIGRGTPSSQSNALRPIPMSYLLPHGIELVQLGKRSHATGHAMISDRYFMAVMLKK